MKNLPPVVKMLILIGALIGIAVFWYMAWRTAGKTPTALTQPMTTVDENKK